MNNQKKIERLDLVLKLINDSDDGVSVSDVYKRLVEEHQLDVSRKTIESDIAEIVKKGFFMLGSKSPLTIYPGAIRECLIHLTNEEITYLLVVLPEGHPLRNRLMVFMGLDNNCLGSE
jgi:hypothetical protein